MRHEHEDRHRRRGTFCSDKPVNIGRTAGIRWHLETPYELPLSSNEHDFVSTLLDEPGKIELEATAFVLEN
ncbi:MAG: hypothetical protein QGF47_08755 [Arenicellales bacterium]|nr:hypothetical protein [Arenicellales bacterium]